MDFKKVVSFPKLNKNSISQDKEWFIFRDGVGERKIRLHDYREMYKIPGLYEYIVMTKLQCQTPQKLKKLLIDEIRRRGMQIDQLKVLDLGAGNGIMGENFLNSGVQNIVGIDILPEAKIATERDRPNIYSNYFVINLKHPPPKIYTKLKSYQFDCLTVASALAFNDIPPDVFSIAYNLIKNDGLIVFNIKDTFIKSNDQSGFYNLITEITKRKIFLQLHRERYKHRQSINGKPIFYTAFLGIKKANIQISDIF